MNRDKIDKGSNDEKSLIEKIMLMFNWRDKDFFLISTLSVFPLVVALSFMVISIFIFGKLWGTPIILFPRFVVLGIGFFLFGLTGFIWIVKRKMPGAGFTIIRGKWAVIMGALWSMVCIYLSFSNLWKALEIILGIY
jgi:hypothetical protein